MSKFLKLKNWLTIEDVAKYLSGAFTELVSEADVLQLALDGRLKLSINFVNPVEVLLGKLMSMDEIPYTELVGKNGTVIRSYTSKQHITEDGDIYIFDDLSPIYLVTGICDLALEGDFRLQVEQKFQSLIGGPELTTVNDHSVLIDTGDGQSCKFEIFSDEPENFDEGEGGKSLIEQIAASTLSDEEIVTRLKIGLEILRASSRFCLANRLPEKIFVVVRRTTLTDFMNSLNETPIDQGVALHAKERITLLKLVIGMAVRGYGYDPSASRSDVPKTIADDLAALEMSVIDDTVRKYLKEAANTVLPAKPRQS